MFIYFTKCVFELSAGFCVFMKTLCSVCVNHMGSVEFDIPG